MITPITAGRVAALAPAMVVALAVPTGVAHGQACRGADSTSADLIQDVVKYTSATDADIRAVRDSLKYAAVAESQVVLVTNNAACQKAANAYAAYVTGPPERLSGQVYVVQAGATYTVLDPRYYKWDPSVWTIVTFDSHWKVLSARH